MNIFCLKTVISHACVLRWYQQIGTEVPIEQTEGWMIKMATRTRTSKDEQTNVEQAQGEVIEPTGGQPTEATPSPVDVTSLSAEQRKALAEALKEARKAEREARSTVDVERLARDKEMLGDVVGRVVSGTEKITTKTDPDGFFRYTGTVEIEGVKYNATIRITPAKR